MDAQVVGPGVDSADAVRGCDGRDALAVAVHISRQGDGAVDRDAGQQLGRHVGGGVEGGEGGRGDEAGAVLDGFGATYMGDFGGFVR